MKRELSKHEAELLNCLKLMLAANGGHGLDAEEYERVLAATGSESSSPVPVAEGQTDEGPLDPCAICGHFRKWHNWRIGAELHCVGADCRCKEFAAIKQAEAVKEKDQP